ncbi:MAG: PLP-dependent aminotransferase family protein [Peptostreptococcus sp.]|uniref:MocR-like pyridoxine biosynthesis transcription factor PdxR n=1 Tax=Peptostreptococcus sp. TaxID=1262 RepID=UPI002FCC244F
MLQIKDGLLYLQIYDYFKEEIIKGIFPSEYRLPSKRQLANEYNISINTVENAYSKLLEEGFIYSKERCGYFVSDVGELYIQDNKESVVKAEVATAKYDFSYSGVSKEGFPYKIIRKISNNIIYDMDLLSKVDYQGYLPLRVEISKYLEKSRAFSVDPNQIVISSGSEYLFQIIFKLVGGRYAIEDPSYPMLHNIMDANKIDYEYISVDEHGIMVDLLDNTRANICAITPAHQFPTGVIMNMKRRVDLLNKSTIEYIVEDDYDSEFKYSNRPVPALKSIDYNDKVIYIGSFSKSISPAFRLSYMVLPKKLLNKYHKLYNCFVCPVPIIVQKILTEFIETGEFEKHLNRMRKIYSKKRQTIVESLKSRKDIKISGADAGLHVVLEYPNSYDEQNIVDSALQKGLKVYGLNSYGSKRKHPSILLGFATLSIEELEESIKILKSI